MGKYDKCGADFSEKEYKGAQVINQIERKTVGILHFFLTKLISLILDQYFMYHLYMYMHLFHINNNYFSPSTTKSITK